MAQGSTKKTPRKQARKNRTPKKRRGTKGTKPRPDVYQEVTDAILAALDAGTVPWRNPIASAGFPRNLASGREYRGVNLFLLAMAALSRGHDAPWWLTFKQAQARGGTVRKGETGTRIVFWKLLKREELNAAGEAEEVKLPVLRFYTVFNAAQCDGIAVPATPETSQPHDPIPACDAIAEGYRGRGGPRVLHAGSRAVYDFLTDEVVLPRPEKFASAEEYHGTRFHELAHSTGHPKRLCRRLSGELHKFGSEPYGREELVAECAAAFLCAHAGIGPRTIANQASYIDGWRRTIRGDKRLVVLCAASGQRAADLILGTTFGEPEEGEDAPDQTS